MWKVVNGKYVKALAKFTQSGTHESDFYSFCDGNLAVFYLRECLQLKPNLTQFVEGDMFEEDQFDSLTLNCAVQTPPSRYRSSPSIISSSTKKARNNKDLSKSLEQCSENLSAAIIMASKQNGSGVGMLEKLLVLLKSVEDQIESMEVEGRCTAFYKERRDKLRKKIASVEDELDM